MDRDLKVYIDASNLAYDDQKIAEEAKPGENPEGLSMYYFDENQDSTAQYKYKGPFIPAQDFTELIMKVKMVI